MKRASLLAILVSTTALVSANLAHAQAQSSSLPHNSQLVSGAATVKQTGATTTITQTSQSAILNWQSFSIGRGDTVDVVQPGATSVLLNRVTGQAPSTIAGELNANGQVFLINPNGIVIGKTGVVQASGFVASTLDISDSDFLAGRLNFKATGPSASVVHAGTIRIAPGGYAALLGGSVTDTGEIVAPLGKVAIGAGSAATLDLSGDGFLQVALTGASDTTGMALLSASDARDVVRQTVNMDGVTEAAAATGQDGHVVLSGRIDTSDATGSGGNVKVLGTTLDLGGGVINAGHAQVETSGDTVDFTGIKVSAGNWLVDPTNLTIDSAAAATISSNLATSDVTLQATASGASGPGVQAAGEGDIIVNSAISWSSSHQLTLDAYKNVDIDAPITVSGAGGKLTILTNHLTPNDDYGSPDFGLTDTGFAGRISFTAGAGSGQALTINGTPYLLIYTMAELDAIDGVSGVDGSAVTQYGGVAGYGKAYALAQPLNASGVTYTNALVTGTFIGQFEGLGNTITGLTIHNTTSNDGTGIFAASQSIMIRDIGLVNADVSGPMYVGALVGKTLGEAVIQSSYTNGAVSGGADVGGMAGTVSYDVIDSWSSGTVSDMLPSAFAPGLVIANTNFGGLIGFDNGYVLRSHSSATVNDSDSGTGASNFGGLAGEYSHYELDNSYATGAVTSTDSNPSNFGGFVGYTETGTIATDYATGTVSSRGSTPGGDNPTNFGGLVGYNNGSIIRNSYATGDVISVNGGDTSNFGGFVGSTVGDTITTNYATGAVIDLTPGALSTGFGGFAGYSESGIVNSYATGEVIGGDDVGGLVGLDQQETPYEGSSIQSSYATGRVIGSGTHVGGLVGSTPMPSQVYNSYYDAQTTGQAMGTQADGSKGVSTATLQSVLPSGFLSSTWSTGAGLYPYLTWQYPGGAQAITGFADTAGSTAAAGAALNVYKNGIQLNTGTVYSGANGYYYALVPANTVVYKTPIGTTMTLAGATGISGIAFIDTPAVTGSVVNNRTIMAGRIYGWESQPTWSSLLSEMSSTFGAGLFSSLETTSAFNHTDIYALLPTFTIDTAQDVTGTFKVTEENHTGTLIDAAPITVEPGGTVMLISNGPLAIDAPAAVKGNGTADLRYDYWVTANRDPTMFTFGTGGSLTYLTSSGATASNGQGGTLKINDAAYTLVYTLSQLDALDGVNGINGASISPYGGGLFGTYALANTLDASGVTYTRPLVGNNISVFYGMLEGLGHTISNLTITAPSSSDIGLVGYLSGTVRDLNIANGNIAGLNSVGGFAGVSDGNVYDVAFSGTVTGMDGIGGLVGLNQGGLFDSHAAGQVTGTGGITGQSVYVGGLVGDLGVGTIDTSYATNTVTGSQYVGGLTGAGEGNPSVGAGTISRSYSTGQVIGGADVGGLVGGSEVVIIQNSYYAGAVSGQTHIGGLVGAGKFTITDSYASGLVSGANAGGLVGALNDGGTITNSYYDADTTGQPLGPQPDGSVGLTTAQMSSGTLPTGFDPAIWTAAAGHYPKLKAVAGQ